MFCGLHLSKTPERDFLYCSISQINDLVQGLATARLRLSKVMAGAAVSQTAVASKPLPGAWRQRWAESKLCTGPESGVSLLIMLVFMMLINAHSYLQELLPPH